MKTKLQTLKSIRRVAAKPAAAGIPPSQTKALLSRLRRAEGQVRAVVRQIEAGHDCNQIAQQLNAARKALDKAFFAMAGCAIEHGQITPDNVSEFLVKYA